MPINNSYDRPAVIKAVAEAIEQFYNSLISSLDELDAMKIIRRKNPYLYRAKDVSSAHDFCKVTLDAFVSSSEETIFGNIFFEPIAIIVSGGNKSSAGGLDIDIVKKNVYHSISVKSGTSVFNSGSKNNQETKFKKARQRVVTKKVVFDAIIGYCYGRKAKPRANAAPHIYRELAGQEFWEELTGDSNFYLDLLRFIGNNPSKYTQRFMTSYTNALNRLECAFLNNFCASDGSIDWEKVLIYNSAKNPPQIAKANKKPPKP